MKKALLLLIILAGTAHTAFSQTANADFLGYWKSNQTSAQLVFYTTSQGVLKIMAWDATDGEVLEISGIVADGNTINCDMYTKSTDWKIHSVYTLANRNLIEERITNQEGEVIDITYSRTNSRTK